VINQKYYVSLNGEFKMKDHTVIDTRGNIKGAQLNQILENYELIVELAKRNIKTKYRKSYLGVIWAFIQPLLYMFVIYAFFSMITKFDTGPIPYPLFLLLGIIPMQFFLRMIAESPGSLMGNSGLMSRIYIPQIVFPAACFLSALIDFFFPLVILVIFLLFFDITLTTQFIFVPLIFSFFLLLCFSTHLFLSAVLGHIKEVKNAIPAIVQVFFFGSPIFYPTSVVPDYLLSFYYLNPMVGVLEIFRWSLLGYDTFINSFYVYQSLFIGLCFIIFSMMVFPPLAKNTNHFLD
tara:strand:+ start:650 stop:1522 length:873 start_codon:yes stop_codon:yes gene_type:complete